MPTKLNLKQMILILIILSSFLNAGLATIKNFDDRYTDDNFKQYNYRYRMVAIDTRSWTKHKKDILKKRKIVTKFGNALGKKAIVQVFIMKTSKKRAYLKKIQKQLSTHYNVNQAPFLIFFKKEGKKYSPYKIISLSSISTPYLKDKLSLLGEAITSGKSNKKVYANLDRVKKRLYASSSKKRVTQQEKNIVEKLLFIVRDWFL